MGKVAKERKLIMWTILLLALMQMPHIALNAGVDLIATTVFPHKTLAEVQSVIALPNLISLFSGVASAMLIRYGLLSKKTAVVVGVALVAVTGITAILLHTEFWQFCMLSVIVGAGVGLFVPNAQSIMLDTFNEVERQALTGVQFSFINIGGITMTVLGGLITTEKLWYGGYTIFLIVIPVTILAMFALPKDKIERTSSGARAKATPLPRDVYFYAVVLGLFLLIYNVASNNISTHLAQYLGVGPSLAGVVASASMVGGVFSGLLFGKISAKLGDYAISLSFIVVGLSFFVLGAFATSLVAAFAAMFISGTTISVLVPQCLFDVSNIVDHTNSATATMITSCIASGLGGFLSPVVFTNLTQLFSDDTRFRFIFVAVTSLVLGVLHVFIASRRAAKKG